MAVNVDAKGTKGSYSLNKPTYTTKPIVELPPKYGMNVPWVKYT
ncbi:MAG: hypothetical protein NMNS02_31050 [Nitrosomonas sp.]|nr:MAG: hypothetical protein NMNS02_31050 [Nitrosomonas sp.]